MAPRSRLSIAKSDILKAVNDLNKPVLTRSDLEQLLSKNRGFWRLATGTTLATFTKFLAKSGAIQIQELKFPRPTIRYALPNAKSWDVFQSIGNGYFSHYSAIYFHELTEQAPKTVYFNIEQKLEAGSGELTQAGINRSFAKKCRTTNNFASLGDQKICVLNGANTGQLGVIDFDLNGSKLRITNVERTLIDIVVRPIYSGGISQVADAYSLAAKKVSINRLCSYLRKIGYTYPYHQSIGYLMERSGKYTDAQISLLEQFETKYDFVLDYGLKDPVYVPKWHLFVPDGF